MLPYRTTTFISDDGRKPHLRIHVSNLAKIESSEKITPAAPSSYPSLVKKLAYVAQDRVDIAEAVMSHETHDRATKWTQVRTQKDWVDT